jgi:hypothetical protein
MRYWWVNQNQTYRHEFQGGYLWSPKRNANGARNPFYESMREVAPGDLILSFVDTRIVAVGIAQSYCWESPKLQEFGTAGQNWENIGWKVTVKFTELENKVLPKDHMGVLRPLLPERYSPLQPNGNGLQSVYLTEARPTADPACKNLSTLPQCLHSLRRGLLGAPRRFVPEYTRKPGPTVCGMPRRRHGSRRSGNNASTRTSGFTSPLARIADLLEPPRNITAASGAHDDRRRTGGRPWRRDVLAAGQVPHDDRLRDVIWTDCRTNFKEKIHTGRLIGPQLLRDAILAAFTEDPHRGSSRLWPNCVRALVGLLLVGCAAVAAP